MSLVGSVCVFGQSYNGPSTGTVSSGAVVSTDEFSTMPLGEEFPAPSQVRKFMDYFSEETSTYDGPMGNVSKNYYYFEDTNAGLNSMNGIGENFVLHSFASIQMTNSIPPDPHMAVGPNHVISTVNSVFAIYDRSGNLLKTINADAWCGRVLANPGAFDPQIIYDHYQGRWFMLWDSQNSGTLTGHFIIAYSDDDNPIGTWYMYALDATMNGNTPSNPKNWGDYPQLGYDDQGIYISSRQFIFSNQQYAGMKIRILNKSELYAANGGPLTFTDLWNIRLPNGQSTDDLHPTISYDAGNNTAYFVIVPNGGVFYYLYKITNPITTPVLSGITLPVTFFGVAPDAQQLGGGSPLDAGAFGSGMRNAPIIRDDSLYAVHHIASSQYPGYGSIKYFVINLNNNTVSTQVEFGAQGFYYIYPSIAVDLDHNIAITYTRSGLTEYAGSYYTTRLATDPPGFSPSKVMTEGKGNYVVTFGGDRNRWGDYLCAYLDPVNQYNIWLYSEYAAATNTWGTWLTEIRMKTFAGIYTFVSPSTLDCGDVEVNNVSDEFEIVIANYGSDTLRISDIAASVGPFTRTSNHSFPVTLLSFDTLIVKIRFSPTIAGDYDEMLNVNSNDPALTGLHLVGHAYDMLEAYTNMFYASTGSGNNGDMLTLDKTTGIGTTLGPSLFPEVKRIAVNPLNNIIYGIVSEAGGTGIVRVNAGEGDAYNLFNIDLPSVSGIAFDTLGTMYVARQTGQIYSVDLTNGSYTLVTQAAISVNSMAFEPATNQLWVAIFKAVGTGKDSIYTVDLTTGAATPIGVTGFSIMTNDLAFDNDSKLYGVIGAANSIGKLIEINKSNGTGTQIGETGFNHVVGLGYSLNGPVVSVEGNTNILPKEFALKQNYPNPFNPTTKIEFSLPVAADVQLVVYNILGQQVASLINDQRSAGNHSVLWNANDSNGMKLSSGIYFYMLKASGVDGNEFQEIKKMVLLK